MADSTLSALPAAAALGGTELLYGVQSAADVKITATQIKTFATTGYATLGANTFTALQTITQASANAGIIASTGYSLTGSDATGMVNLAGTWNTSGNPVALKIAMTNTASGATSKFVSFLAGAGGVTEVFSVDKSGNIVILSNTASITGGTDLELIATGGNKVHLSANGFYPTNASGTVNLGYTGAGATFHWGSVNAAGPYSFDHSGTIDTFISSPIAAKVQLGAADAAAPVAQTLSVQSVVAGTSNTAGADWNITGSLSTGSGIAGKIIFNLSQIVAAATAQNAASPVITLSNIIGTGIRFNGYGAGAITSDASGNLTAASDERMKDVLGDFDVGLAELERIQPILYRWKDGTGMETEHEYAGFAAGNVRDAIPMATGLTPDGYMTLQDRALLAACVNAIKQLSAEIRR